MNNLIVQISKLLIKHDGFIPLYLACENLGITKRMLTYNLNKLNDILEDLDEKHILIEDGNLKFDIKGAIKLEKFLLSLKMEDYIYTFSERRDLVFIIIALYPSIVSIDLLSDLIGVSRSTLTSEINEIKDYFLLEDFALEYYPNKGYFVCGSESNIRFKIVEMICNFPNYVIKNIVDNNILKWCSTISDIEEKKILNLLEDIISNIDESTSVSYVMNSRFEMIRYFLIIYLRNSKGIFSITMFNYSEYSEYIAAKFIVQNLQKKQFSILDEEIGYITSLLLGTKLVGICKQVVEPEIFIMASSLYESFRNNSSIETELNRDLFDMFLIHVRSMIYRIKFNIKIDIAFSENILPQFPFLTQWGRLAVKEFEDQFNISISEDEFSYLCIYFAMFLPKQSNSNITQVKSILIICGAGAGTSYFVKKQLVTLLGSKYNYEIIDYKQSHKVYKDHYDLIISTVNLDNIIGNYIEVDPILTEKQKIEILNWSLEEISSTNNLSDIKKILSIIEKYADINDRVNLVGNLRKELDLDNSKTLTLKDVFKERHLQIIDEEVDSNKAIKIGCQPLLDEGVIDIEYENEILDIINQLGLYSEYIPGILLAHAKSDGHVHEVGITCTIFKKPVEFEKWGRKISVIVTFATYSTKAHSIVIDDLFSLLKNQKLINLLLNYKESDLSEIKELFGLEEGDVNYGKLD